MRKKIIINTSNLQKGGALQVAVSFVQEAASVSNIDFCIVLGEASSQVISPKLYKHLTHLSFETVAIQPTQSVSNLLRFKKALFKIETKFRPDGVITVFGSCYWKPRAPHIMGFANGYLLYEDTYFFTIWQGWKSIAYKAKKALHRYLIKSEAKYYWTETEDSKKRLSKFTGKPLSHITVATNNCGNFFRHHPYSVLETLPPQKAFRLLYVSSYYVHKGFELIPPVLKQLKAEGIDVEMVVTIQPKDFERLFRGFDNVINLEAVAPQYCPYLYQQSDMVFVPSLLETFTAVYPEAMYAQKPLLTTNLPFATGICGDAALYFDPKLVDDAVQKIKQLMNDDALRKNLIAKGLEQLKILDLPESRFNKVLQAICKIG